jgi:hypothetical protein
MESSAKNEGSTNNDDKKCKVSIKEVHILILRSTPTK